MVGSDDADAPVSLANDADADDNTQLGRKQERLFIGINEQVNASQFQIEIIIIN